LSYAALVVAGLGAVTIPVSAREKETIAEGVARIAAALEGRFHLQQLSQQG
jgi:hypothetical protein